VLSHIGQLFSLCSHTEDAVFDNVELSVVLGKLVAKFSNFINSDTFVVR
jgi:hypothetical protein